MISQTTTPTLVGQCKRNKKDKQQIRKKTNWNIIYKRLVWFPPYSLTVATTSKSRITISTPPFLPRFFLGPSGSHHHYHSHCLEWLSLNWQTSQEIEYLVVTVPSFLFFRLLIEIRDIHEKSLITEVYLIITITYSVSFCDITGPTF